MGYNLDMSIPNEKVLITVPNMTYASKLFKKSQHLGQWNVRYILMNDRKLYSFKHNTSHAKSTFDILSSNAR
jgi:hypothetical protein